MLRELISASLGLKSLLVLHELPKSLRSLRCVQHRSKIECYRGSAVLRHFGRTRFSMLCHLKELPIESGD